MKPVHRLWCLLLMVAVSSSAEEDWMLHTPGGGPLESRCPCMSPELCPRMFGDSEYDVRHFGHIPICMDSRQIRCCGASFRVELSGVSGHVARSGQEYDVDGRSKGNNNQAVEQTITAQQMVPQQHADSSQTALRFLPQHQPKGTVDSEDYIDSFNRSSEMRNDSIISLHHPRSQQPEHIRNTEHLQKDPKTDSSGSSIVYPRRTEGNFDSTEPEDVFLVYPSNSSKNNTKARNTNMTDAGSLSSNMAESQLFESEDDNREYLIEIPISSDTEQAFAEAVGMPEKEYLVASGSEYNGVRTHNKMQEDTEDDDDDNEDEVNGDKIESPVHGLHTRTEIIQTKRPNIPKRSFVSQNLKMRISQLATGRRNPASDEVRTEDTRHLTGPKSGQKQPEVVTDRQRGSTSLLSKTITPNRYTRPEANKILLDISVDRKAVRSRPLERLRSNAKPSMTAAQDITIASHASKSQNPSSRHLSRNYTHGIISDIAAFQVQDGRLREGVVDYQVHEMAFPRHRQMHLKRNSDSVPENTDLFTAGGNSTMEITVIQPPKSNQNEIDEHRKRPVVRRKTTETAHRTFGARTKTRNRPSSFQRRPTQANTTSGAPKFSHNQQTGHDEHHLSESEAAGMDTRGSLIGEIPMEGLINVVGPIPKGFTDPATMQHLDSPNYMSPLFHLPHPTQPEPFRNQIQNSMMPLVSVVVKPSTSDTLPSSGVTSFKDDVNPFRRPYTQAFQQHYTFRHSENLPPQKYIQTIIATSNLPNEENVSKHEWQLHEQKKLVSDRFNIIPSLAQSSLTAATSSLPSMRNLAEFTEPHPFHFPPPNYLQRATLPHTSIVVQHSSPDDKTVLLPQTSPFQKFLSYTEQQLKQPGHQNEDMASLSTRVPQPSTEKQSMPSLDATHHAAQSEYTTKLMEYFQHLQHE